MAGVLERTGFVLTLAYGLVGLVFMAGEAFVDPGGWRAVGLISSWLVPLLLLVLLVRRRPLSAGRVLTVMTAVAVVISLWQTMGADRRFDRPGPVAAALIFVTAVPLGVLGRRRPVVSGLLLLVLGGAPLLFSVLGPAPFVLGSTEAAVLPPLLVGVAYLASVVAPRPRRAVSRPPVRTG